jgi:phosphoenolpyruvate carboxykinase (ATP)
VMYHFVQGFTAKLAGTEVGLTEPQATFSACFGAPFMSRPPSVYARLLQEKMQRHKTRCVLLNTGWHGGPAGKVPRISIRDTRALLNAALEGRLHDGAVGYDQHSVFGLRVPRTCPGVDSALLDPRAAWQDKQAYDQAAQRLAGMFRDNFARNGFADYGIREVI